MSERILATFLGGPADLHRVALPDSPSFYFVPVFDRPQFAMVDFVSPQPVRVKNARYRLFKLPNPEVPSFTRNVYVYLFEGIE